MLIKQRRATDIRASEITDERLYLSRRDLMRAAAGATVGAVVGAAVSSSAGPALAQEPLADVRPSAFSTDEEWTTYEDLTKYNNFYEFGADKGDPVQYAGRLTTKPWTVEVEGEMHAPKAKYLLEDILKPHALEERIYRLRCVEAWSMVVPWIGFPLADLIKRFDPTSDARFVEFQTLRRPSEMPAQRPVAQFPSDSFGRSAGPTEVPNVLRWPYVEGLRMDEAMNPLTLLAIGLYGKTLPNQNGAPIRLVVPWKYGFKSIKSIVKIRFVKNRPRTTWNRAFPRDFGFYANVNPEVDRPQSQATERRFGKFFPQRTLMFNGYADQVGQMYAGMDLTRDY